MYRNTLRSHSRRTFWGGAYTIIVPWSRSILLSIWDKILDFNFNSPIFGEQYEQCAVRSPASSSKTSVLGDWFSPYWSLAVVDSSSSQQGNEFFLRSISTSLPQFRILALVMGFLDLILALGRICLFVILATSIGVSSDRHESSDCFLFIGDSQFFYGDALPYGFLHVLQRELLTANRGSPSIKSVLLVRLISLDSWTILFSK